LKKHNAGKAEKYTQSSRSPGPLFVHAPNQKIWHSRYGASEIATLENCQTASTNDYQGWFSSSSKNPQPMNPSS